MKNPILIVKFSVVDSKEIKPAHLDVKSLAGLHSVRMYDLRNIADGCAGFIVGTDANKFFESVVLMGVLDE